MTWLWLAFVIALGLVLGLWVRRLLIPKPGEDIGEWCVVCEEDLTADDAMVRREPYGTIPGESDHGGGTYGEAWYCRKHAPEDAVPFGT